MLQVNYALNFSSFSRPSLLATQMLGAATRPCRAAARRRGFLLCIVCAQLCGFQHLDAFGLERGAQSLGKAGARHLVLDAEGDDAMQAGAFQTDGSAVRRHPGLEVLDVPGQLRAGRGEAVAQLAHPEVRRKAADVLAHLEDALFDAEAGFLLVDPVDPAHLLRNTEQFSLSGRSILEA